MKFYRIGNKIKQFENESEIIDFLTNLDYFSDDTSFFYENYCERYRILTGIKIDISEPEAMLDHLYESGFIERVECVFVYGTLRKGLHNHYLLEGCISGGDVMIQNFDMVSLISYPAAIKGNGQIIAEMYYVNEYVMKSLDRLEGYPNFYNRKRVIPSNHESEGWIYYMENGDDYTKLAKRVICGDWKKYLSTVIDREENIIRLFENNA